MAEPGKSQGQRVGVRVLHGAEAEFGADALDALDAPVQDTNAYPIQEPNTWGKALALSRALSGQLHSPKTVKLEIPSFYPVRLKDEISAPYDLQEGCGRVTGEMGGCF